MIHNIIMSYSEWELWLLFIVWSLVPIMLYWGEKQDEHIAILQKKADDALRNWANK